MDQKVTNNEQKVASNEQKVTNNDQTAKRLASQQLKDCFANQFNAFYMVKKQIYSYLIKKNLQWETSLSSVNPISPSHCFSSIR